MVAGRAGAVLGDGGEVRLVLDEDRRRQPFLERPDEAAVPGGQAGAVPQLPGDRVDEPGRADADAVQGALPALPTVVASSATACSTASSPSVSLPMGSVASASVAPSRSATTTATLSVRTSSPASSARSATMP